VVLDELMQALGPPRDLDAGVEVVEETDALDAIGTPEVQEKWALLPRNAQQAWLSTLVARTRALKELPTASEATRERIKQIIGRYPPWAKEHVPGHVNGMQVKHAPAHGSWARDARACWRALDELLGEQGPVRLPVAAPSSRTKLQRSDESDEAPDSESGPPWRLLPLVSGRKAVMFGGDPREASRERLERGLQLASLEWPPIDGPRKVEAAVERIRKGSYGLVLVLSPFVFHQQSNPIIEAAKDSGVTWALVEGYGLAAVKLGLERFFGRAAGLTARQE
jgi:hypothetical protein